MKIFTDRTAVRNTSNNIQKKRSNEGSATAFGTQNAAKNTGFDQITISRSSTNKLSDDQFISLLSKQLFSEVKSGASTYVLEDLHRQVALDQYDINASDIARRLLSE